MSACWRLIVDCSHEGAWNMAADRALLDAHVEENAPPTLRLYSWKRPTVTIGRFQKAETVDLRYCVKQGIGVARRPTGGRGVLHDNEVTYSVVAGVRDGLPRGVNASYRVLCSALETAYRALGVRAQLTARDRGTRGSAACYLHATAADISLGTAKLSGSAQVWSNESCLQHGSFVISRNIAREAAVFGLDTAASDMLAESTSTLQDALGRAPLSEEIVRAVSLGVSSALGVHFEQGSFSDWELDRIEVSNVAYEVPAKEIRDI